MCVSDFGSSADWGAPDLEDVESLDLVICDSISLADGDCYL